MKRLTQLIAVEIVFVFGAGLALKARDLDQEIKSQVMRQFQLDAAWHEIDILSNQIKTSSYGDGDSITIRPLSQKEPIGLFTVQATVLRNGSPGETGQVSLRIRKFDTVLVAIDNMRAFETPAAEKITLQRMDITSLQEQPEKSFGAIAGFRCKRNIGKGQVLTSGAIEPVPDIDVGGEVSIICSNGLFTVTAPGQALQKGYAGDQIRVKNHASNRIVQATVVDARTVAVQP